MGNSDKPFPEGAEGGVEEEAPQTTYAQRAGGITQARTWRASLGHWEKKKGRETGGCAAVWVASVDLEKASDNVLHPAVFGPLEEVGADLAAVGRFRQVHCNFRTHVQGGRNQNGYRVCYSTWSPAGMSEFTTVTDQRHGERFQ